jgi:hypothetical protein
MLKKKGLLLSSASFHHWKSFQIIGKCLEVTLKVTVKVTVPILTASAPRT